MKGHDMTATISGLQQGNTLIKDHKAAVQALEDVLACTTTAEAKKTAKAALKKLGEPGYSEDDVKPEPCIDDLVTRKQ